MKAYEGYEAKKAASASEALPAGGYVAKILKAEVQEYSWGDVLVISFDIAEGDFKGHFRKRWDADASSDYGQKWKGNFRLNIPSEKSKYPDSDKRAFNNAMWAIENSNPRYKWNWQEETLKGKMIGVLFRNKEWEKDGNSGWTTECCTVTSVADIRNGDFVMPKDKPLKKSESSGTTAAPTKQETAAAAFETAETIDDDEVPF
jgi:hypothetical protein